MNKNYCIFSAQFLPHLGGIERYTYNVARKLVESGDNVVIVTNNTTESKSYEEIDGMKIYRFPCYNILNGRFPVMKINGKFLEISKILNKESFDVIIINARFYLHSIYAARFAKKKDITCICIEHGTSHLSVHNQYLDKLGAWYEHMHTKILKHYCKKYYGVSNACCEWLGHFHIQPQGVFYNAVDLKEIEKIKNNILRDFRKEYQISQDEIVVTFTGRLLKEKGIYQLIEAVQKFNEGKRQVHLMLAGDGEEWEYVKARESRYIHPLGKLGFKEIIWLLVKSDIFCLPSFSEGFSTSALEAAACGCYIITTERGGTKELFAGKEYGTVMKDNNVSTILAALTEVVCDEEKREKAKVFCYKQIETFYTWERTADAIKTAIVTQI